MTNLSHKHTGPMTGRPLTLGGLFAAFKPQIAMTWGMTLIEVGLFAITPLLIGQAIDGLLNTNFDAYWLLGGVLVALIFLGTLRRVYDTRAYGLMRVHLGKELARRSSSLSISAVNARLGMGRELADFLEKEAPEAMAGLLRSLATIVILWSFAPHLALAALVAFIATLGIYALSNLQFYRLNGALNQQLEQQVRVLEAGSLPLIGSHLLRLRRSEIRLSGTEGVVYGLIFTVLLGFVMFNLWFASQQLVVTAGMVFAIITYSWDFVESSLALPTTLQSLSRLSEITNRINTPEPQL